MKSIFAALLMAVMIWPAASLANPCDNIPEATRGKGIHEIQTILAACRSPETVITQESAEKWSQLASTIGETISKTAREAGVAANEFLNSPAGLLLAGLLVIHYAGSTVFTLLAGLPFALFMMVLAFQIYKWSLIGEIKYENVPVLWGLWNRRREVSRENFECYSDSRGFMTLIAIAGCAIVAIIGLFAF